MCQYSCTKIIIYSIGSIMYIMKSQEETRRRVSHRTRQPQHLLLSPPTTNNSQAGLPLGCVAHPAEGTGGRSPRRGYRTIFFCDNCLKIRPKNASILRFAGSFYRSVYRVKTNLVLIPRRSPQNDWYSCKGQLVPFWS